MGSFSVPAHLLDKHRLRCRRSGFGGA